MSDREDRIARNESLFREVNERIRDVPPEGPEPEHSGFLCECGDAACTETVLLSLEEYEAVRSDPATFAVLPTHVIEDVEEVVARTDRFVTVRKYPEEAAIANDTDPRRRDR
jgi:hypothetical protein